MQTSVFLARLLGPALLLIGVGVLLNRDYYRAMIGQFTGSRPLMYIAAVIGIVAGLAIVLVHNVWTLNWRVLITLLGWANLLRGAASILFPAQTLAFAERIAANRTMPIVAGAVPLTIGAILTFYGYFA